MLTSSAEAVAAEIHPVVETSHAAIESRRDRSLRVRLLANGDQPGLVFRPVRGVWDWSKTSKMSIAVANPGDAPLALLLRIESAEQRAGPGRSLSGEATIAPKTAGDLTVWLDAPPPRTMGTTAGPSLGLLGWNRGPFR